MTKIKVYPVQVKGSFSTECRTYRLIAFKKEGLLLSSTIPKGFIGENIPWILPYENIGTICAVVLAQ